MEENRIREARYNKKYKEIMWIDRPSYLQRVDLDWIEDGIRALMMLRCGNMEESNKHWIEENCRICVFLWNRTR